MITAIALAVAIAAPQDVQGIPAQFRGVWISGDGIVATLAPTVILPGAGKPDPKTSGNAFGAIWRLREQQKMETMPKGSSFIFCKGERVYVSGPNRLVPEGSYMAPWVNTPETKSWRDYRVDPQTLVVPGLKEPGIWDPTRTVKAVETGLMWIGFGPAMSDGSIDRLKVKITNQRGNPVLGVRDQDWYWAGDASLIDVTGSWKARDATSLDLYDQPGDWTAGIGGTLTSNGRKFALRGKREGPFVQIEMLHPATGAAVGFGTLVWDPQSSDIPTLKSGKPSVSKIRAFLYLVDNTWPSGYSTDMTK